MSGVPAARPCPRRKLQPPQNCTEETLPIFPIPKNRTGVFVLPIPGIRILDSGDVGGSGGAGNEHYFEAFGSNWRSFHRKTGRSCIIWDSDTVLSPIKCEAESGFTLPGFGPCAGLSRCRAEEFWLRFCALSLSQIAARAGDEADKNKSRPSPY